MKGVFVAGTDTGVGKTLAAAALLHALHRHHARVVGMKPVAAGAIRTGNDWASEDALALRAGATLDEATILALIAQLDVGGGRGMVVPSEYAEIVVTVA